MATRTATLDFKSTGADTSSSNVVRLADALEKQRAKAEQVAAALPKTRKEIDALAVTSRAGAEELARFASPLGALGVGLAHVSTEAPRAAQHLLALAGAGERASIMSRTLNASLFAGGAVVATAAIGLVAYTRHLSEMADAYASLEAKTRIYTKGQVEAAQVQNSIFSTARDSRTSVENTARLFSRLEPEIQDTGRRPQDAVRLAGIVSKALAIQGATAQEQSYGTTDLLHAISTGTVDSRALRGLQRESPVLLRYIAQNMGNGKGGFGVPTGDLNKLAHEKKLTSESVLDALFRAQPQVEADLQKAPKLASQAYQALSDSVMRTVGELGQLTGAQPGLVSFLSNLADRSDRFRESLERDPQAIANVRAGLSFIGQTVDGIGNLGGEAFKHLDLIVKAAELIISLKVGEAVASWFSVASQGALTTARNLREFAAQARFNAGAKVDPVGAKAAQELRAAATAADLRAAQSADRAGVMKAKAATAQQLAEGKIAEAARLRSAAVVAADEAQRIADEGASAATRDRAAADRLAAQAAEIRARLEADAAARSAEAAAARDAAGASSALSGAGIGSAGAYFAKQAQADAVGAMRLTEAERAAQLTQLQSLEAQEARYAATVTASEGRVAQATQSAGAARAEASALATQAEVREADAATAAAAAQSLRTRAETSAAGASAANAAAAAATERAMAAEAAVAAEATGAMVAQNVAMGVLTGAYNLLGGGIGIATLAIGGLIYALWQEEQSFRQQAEALRASVVVSQQMRAVTDQMTTATWSQLPALRAQAQALRDVAHARLEGAPPGGGPNLRQKLAADQAALKETQSQISGFDAGNPNADRGEYFALIRRAAQQKRQVGADETAVQTGVADVRTQDLEGQRGALINLNRTIQHNNDLLERGRNDRGDALTAGERQQGAAAKADQRSRAQREYDALDARYKQEEANQRRLKLTGRPEFQDGLRRIGELRDLASEAIHATDPLEKVNSSLADKQKKPKARGDVDSALKRALEEIEQQQTYGADLTAKAAGMDRFGVADGKVRDLTTGKLFEARSQDEAKAAQRFQDQLALINKATGPEVTKYGGGRTKEQLRAASEEAFRLALAGSQAAKQDEALIQGLQRLGLAAEQESTKLRELDALIARNPEGWAKLSKKDQDELKAKAAAADADAFVDKLKKLGLAAEDPKTKVAELTSLIDANGAAWGRLTDVQQGQLRAWAELVDKVDAAKKAVSSAKPIFDEQWKLAEASLPKESGRAVVSGDTAVLAGTRFVGSRGGGFRKVPLTTKVAKEFGIGRDVEGDQLARLQAVSETARAGFEEAIRAKYEKLAQEEPWKREQFEKRAQDEIATYRIQSEAKIAEETAKIHTASTEARTKREEVAASKIEGALHDLLFGGSFTDVGKRITNDLLQSMYSELVGNPLKLMIQQAMANLFKPGQGGTTGSFLSLVGSLFGIGGVGSLVGPSAINTFGTISPSAGLGPLMNLAGSIPGFAGGSRAGNGRISGPGTGTSDSILALWAQHPVRIASGETIMSAAATQRFAPMLDAMNRTALPRFADGSPVWGGGGAGLAGGHTIVNDYRTNAPPVQHRTMPNGDQVFDIRDMLQKGIRANPEVVRDAAFAAPPKVTRRT